MINPSFAQKTYTTKYANAEIKIDGHLDEAIWSELEVATNFVENYPNFGVLAERQTECMIFYGPEELYFAARVYDDTDSVSYFMSQRDRFGNADYVGLTIDTYGNKLNAFAFYVTAAGVELDALVNEERFDYSWNAVWRSRTQPTEYGWSVEMRIPYSAIRFPNADKQTWLLNFERMIRRTRVNSYWNPVDPEKYGEIAQSGNLEGVENIKPPLRLSFSPYSIGYVERNSFQGNATTSSRIATGLDVKWGLNDAFTLDMTLVPDFGQTISDNQVLNLGPFEVAFDENRPFFLEGTDLFGIGNVFYSRRIGSRPFNQRLEQQNMETTGDELLVSSPGRAPLLNGSKVSGRTKSGLGIGVFNAIEGRTASIFRDSTGREYEVETNPLTNYNVTVFSQNLANNGRVSFLNTNVMREGQARDANVSVVSSQIFSKDRNYSFSGTYKLSDIIRPTEHDFGHAFNIGMQKEQGSFRYGFRYYEESDDYNPNDLGLLFANNSRGMGANANWNQFKPKGRFLRKWANAWVGYEELYFPRLFSSFDMNWGVGGTFRNFLTAGINGGFAPLGFVSHFESRHFGVPVNYAPSFRIGGFYSSDYSKPFALDARFNTRQFAGSDQHNYNFNISPRFQFSSQFFLTYTADYTHFQKDYGYVLTQYNPNRVILLGNRNRDVVTNSLEGELIFTKRMGTNIRFRHYWQTVNYLWFGELQPDGEQVRSAYNELNENGESIHNTTFNAFTIDVTYRWVFFPGCEFQVFFKNNIFASKQANEVNYFNTFDTLFDQPQLNSLSAKVLVFIDALYLTPSRNRI